MDARNFFSADVEPLKQHQYGATFGGPIRRNKVFLFGFWEGFRNRQGITKSATVPTPQERQGDFSGLQDPSTGNQLINFATGQPIPGNRIPAAAFNPASQRVLNYYPLGTCRRRCSELLRYCVTNRIRADSNWTRAPSESDQVSLRYSVVSGATSESALNSRSRCARLSYRR